MTQETKNLAAVIKTNTEKAYAESSVSRLMRHIGQNAPSQFIQRDVEDVKIAVLKHWTRITKECKDKGRITTRKDGFYRCNACKLDFTVRTGT